MDRFARVILGYHGCLEPIASALLSGRLPIEQWAPSENAWDWLGHGLYFWEHSPQRALDWARAKARRHNKRSHGRARPGVVGAVIQLGQCFDLTDVAYSRLLGESYRQLERTFASEGRALPQNTGSDYDLLKRELDCLVVNSFVQCADIEFQTVRGAFAEGPPAYPGAKLMEQTHIQIVVRDKSCILGLFRPNL